MESIIFLNVVCGSGALADAKTATTLPLQEWW